MQLIDVYTSEDAAKVLYDICNERKTEDFANISFKMPPWEEHEAFVNSHPFAYWELIKEGKYHGYVSLTWRNELGIVLFRDSRGKGLGKRALKMFMESHEPLPAIPSERAEKWLANINPYNERSKRLFESLGFRHIQETYACEP